MRPFVHCLACIALSALAVASWADEPAQFPYTAYITADDVQARSGPGKNYYATEKLPRGSTVEVYRHDPGGWYAVRPPEGSFTWVSAKFLEVGENGVGVVTADRVAARVGASDSDLRDVIQVQLDKGEEVQVLEAQRFGSGESAQTWYKISPPAGEFRWVFGQYLSQDPPAERRAKKGSRNRLIRDEPQTLPGDEDAEPLAGEERSAPRARDEDPDEELTADSESMADGQVSPAAGYEPGLLRRSERTASRDSRGNDLWRQRSGDESPRLSREDANRASEQIQRTLDRYADRTPGGLRDRDSSAMRDPWPIDRGVGRDDTYGLRGDVRDPREDEQHAVLDRLNEDLSRMVAGTPSSWALDAIERRANGVMDDAASAMVRARARKLLGQVERFQDIRKRQSDLARYSRSYNVPHSNVPLSTQPDSSAGPETAPAPVPEYALDRTPAAGRAPVRREVDGRFDGTGRLTPVASQRLGAPQYALVDEQGAVRYYVTPAPGVSLRRYVGQEVGVTGSRSPLPDGRGEQLTARRVMSLGGRTTY